MAEEAWLRWRNSCEDFVGDSLVGGFLLLMIEACRLAAGTYTRGMRRTY